MKSPRHWRIKPLGQPPVTYFFAAGIDHAQLQKLYPGCHLQPIADRTARSEIPNAEHGDDAGEGGDDET